MEKSELEKKYEEMGIWMPENGKEAKVQMNLLRDIRGVENLTRCYRNPTNLEERYSMARELAINYGEDVSDLPEKLNRDEKVNLGLVSINI